MNDTLKALEELTLKLPPLSEQPATVIYHDGKLESFGIQLYRSHAYAVQRCFMPKGFRFQRHTHNEKEVLVVITGALRTVFFEDGIELDVVLRADNVQEIPPLTLHSAEALEDTWVVGITIPAAEGYP